MRLQDEQVSRLRRIARSLGRTPSETSALLVEEGLRRSEFAFIDFRNSPVGRQAYVQGSSLAVWEVVLVARSYDMHMEQTAEHLQWQETRVQAALNYGAAFPDEIEAAIEDNASYDLTTLSRMLPQTAQWVVEG
jgi:hypothetical protein